MFQRLIGLIGENNFQKINNSHILVIGCGGVGGYVIESLVRCGVGNLTIIDCDVIDITNINRQIIALNSNIGKNKVDVFKERILDINQSINIEALNLKLDMNNIGDILNNNFDYVIDCIDDIPVKEEIIKICKSKNINLITSLGTGKRICADKLKITTLDKTNYDPIARRLRKYVKDNNIKGKITVLFSEEIPNTTSNESNVIFSSCFVPNSAGILISNFVIRKIINK